MGLAATRAWKERNREAVRAYNKAYQAAHREEHRQYIAAYRASHPHIEAAHKIVVAAKKKGVLIPADECERCGTPGETHAHHEDYAKPLDVEWLCPRCHRREHGHL